MDIQHPTGVHTESTAFSFETTLGDLGVKGLLPGELVDGYTIRSQTTSNIPFLLIEGEQTL